MPRSSDSATDEERWKELMLKTQEGDKQAYHQLLEEISVCLQKFCVRYLGGIGVAEDCAQECLIAIHKAKHTFDPKRRFLPWMFTIARHKVIDYLRSHSRRAEREFANSEIVEDAVSNASQPGVAEMEVAQLLQKLAPKYREAVVLIKLEGRSIKEAASMLEISETALKVRVHRAFSMLRKILEQESKEPI